MKSRYREYMDRQTVSPDLHARLLALEQQAPREQKVLRPLRWQRWVAAAASLVLVVGLGWFGMGQLHMGASGAKQTTVATESALNDADALETAEEMDMAAPAEGAVQDDTAMDTDEAEQEENAVMDTADAAAGTESAATQAARAWSEETQRLSPYATDNLGDAPNVVRIAAEMTYPEGWRYDHVELHTDAAPYTLDIYLSGTGSDDFEANRDTAFALIGNVEVVRFVNAADGAEIAAYNR